ncbi:MAG: hypothetical protein JJU45_15210 [Acidimicrobiia bacterium]|nr:hypothetical protein [Acidimicrobiia bacterium]
MTDDEFAVELHPGDEAEATALLEWAQAEGVPLEPHRDVAALLPLVPVIGGILTAAAVATLMDWLLAKDECRQAVDFRGDEIKFVTNCDIKDGKVFVIANEGQQVTIHDVPPLLDITAVAKQAVTEGAAAAKAAIEAAGGKADVEARPDAK